MIIDEGYGAGKIDWGGVYCNKPRPNLFNSICEYSMGEVVMPREAGYSPASIFDAINPAQYSICRPYGSRGRTGCVGKRRCENAGFALYELGLSAESQ
jgi:hypothetical protein